MLKHANMEQGVCFVQNFTLYTSCSQKQGTVDFIDPSEFLSFMTSSKPVIVNNIALGPGGTPKKGLINYQGFHL